MFRTCEHNWYGLLELFSSFTVLSLSRVLDEHLTVRTRRNSDIAYTRNIRGENLMIRVVLVSKSLHQSLLREVTVKRMQMNGHNNNLLVDEIHSYTSHTHTNRAID